MTTFDVETKDQNRTRDGAARQYSTRFTKPTEFVDELRRDHEAGLVERNIVRLAIVNGPATIEDVAGRWVPGADRKHPDYATKFVAASYRLLDGEMISLSCPCGVSWNRTTPFPSGVARLNSETTAQALREQARVVQAACAKLKGIELRGGGMYFEGEDEAWTATLQQGIEMPSANLPCAVCGVELHASGGTWKTAEGKTEAYVAGPNHLGCGKAHFDHTHTIEVES